METEIKNEKNGTFTDPRDGKTYKTVTIGDQVWMAENLSHDTSGSPGYQRDACYQNDPKNGEIYGRLYPWDTAVKVAPPHWHLPSMTEWQTLLTRLGGSAAYNQMIPGGASGFDLLFGGWLYIGKQYHNLGSRAYFWSSTGESDGCLGYLATCLGVIRSNQEARLYTAAYKTNFFSLRCLKDN